MRALYASKNACFRHRKSSFLPVAVRGMHCPCIISNFTVRPTEKKAEYSVGENKKT